MNAPPETIRLLADQIRRLESSFRPSESVSIPLGIGGLSELFPHGLPAGSLVELLSRTSGAGAWTLALLLARYACGERKTLVIADPERCFYPPAARKFGLEPHRMIFVRPKNARDALIALAEALRCSAVGVVLGAFEHLHERDSRRLQLAAESGGALGVLLRPASALSAVSFAPTRLLLAPLPSARGRRRMRVEVVRSRYAACGLVLADNDHDDSYSATSAKPQATLNLEINDATNHVRAFSELELAANCSSTARPAG